MTNPTRATPDAGSGWRRRAPGRWSNRRTDERPGDWAAIRDRVDLAEVATRLMGQPHGRKGEHGRRLWWRCPFHEDHNPSFCIEPGRAYWRCFGCQERGDATDLVMKYNRVSFREAVAFIGSDLRLGAGSGPPPRPRTSLQPKPADGPASIARQAAATELVEQSSRRLWTPEGRSALKDLRDRGLNDATIRMARLGWAPDASLPVPGGGRSPRFGGITIPWSGRDGLELVKVRQPRGREPKYAEVYRRSPTIYPGPPFPSLPHHDAVIIVEGEFDALLLGQELEGLAVVITTGSASQRPAEATLRDLESAYRLFLATDADDAGDRCASAWPPRAKRVRPPAPLKDWTEAHQAGIKLRRWWMPYLMSDHDDAADRTAPVNHVGDTTPEADEPEALLPLAWDDARAGCDARRTRAADDAAATPWPWYPEPQQRWVQPPMPPFRREDGKLWFE